MRGYHGGEWCCILSRQISDTLPKFVTGGYPPPPQKKKQTKKKITMFKEVSFSNPHQTTILTIFVRFLGWNLFILLIADIWHFDNLY